MRTRTRKQLPDLANCKECHQARDRRVLDENGVCPMCLLVDIKLPENPLLPVPTYMEGRV
jgi:hypothetical protein